MRAKLPKADGAQRVLHIHEANARQAIPFRDGSRTLCDLRVIRFVNTCEEAAPRTTNRGGGGVVDSAVIGRLSATVIPHDQPAALDGYHALGA